MSGTSAHEVLSIRPNRSMSRDQRNGKAKGNSLGVVRGPVENGESDRVMSHCCAEPSNRRSLTLRDRNN